MISSRFGTGVARFGFSLIASAGLACSTVTATDATSDEAATSAETTGGEGCGSDIPGLMACVEEERYLENLTFIAQPRAPGSAHWTAVQQFAKTQLEAAGFTVELRAYATGVNVIATRAGTDLSDEIVMVSAHYDSRGCEPGVCALGPTECNGADDNATGVAAALEIGRVLGPVSTRRSFAIALWDEEETGLIGATAYVAELPNTAEQIHLLLNFDSIGFISNEPNSQTIPDGFDLLWPVEVAEVEANMNRADFIVGAGDESAVTKRALEVFESMGETTGLSVIQTVLIGGLSMSDLASDLRRSDHAPFWDVAIPAAFITDSTEFRNANYHCGAAQDSIDDLDHTFATQVARGTLAAAVDALELD